MKNLQTLLVIWEQSETFVNKHETVEICYFICFGILGIIK